ncbi:hypothetical protein [Peptoniphilus harei]|uniref:hypothetical protein n=1 Tax=Peptoniphilus harei TaxID=54005 RepID=UPI0029073846|nr:hypothetical protein [Peptoniphilus harei]MDU6099175.1 hypothetical protein [Peptoniphilus harei]
MKKIAGDLRGRNSHDDIEDKSYKFLEKTKSLFSNISFKKFKNLNIKNFLKKLLLFLIILGFNILVCLILHKLLIKNEDLAFGLIGPVLKGLIPIRARVPIRGS